MMTSPTCTRSGPSCVALLDRAHGEAGDVEVVGGHGPGVLGRLAADQRAAGDAGSPRWTPATTVAIRSGSTLPVAM